LEDYKKTYQALADPISTAIDVLKLYFSICFQEYLYKSLFLVNNEL
jgi:hypothetical protein